jgi:NADPH-dependent curcumin reductase CurA
MPASRNRQVRLKTRPSGEPKSDDFEFAEAPIAGPGDGQAYHGAEARGGH